MTLDRVIAGKRIVVCVGAGGVGKTTVAAAIALHAARTGRRTLVMTIDPAKRLAQSLGLPRLDHEERRVPTEKIATAYNVAGPRPAMIYDVAGPRPPTGARTVRGELYALMLDQKRALDEFVERRVSSPEHRRRIFENRIYRGISTSLAGSLEYAAMTKLYTVAEEGRYDLIVLDTPPTSNALDFLEAPRKITEAVDAPAIQWLIRPHLAAGRFSLKLVSFGGAFVLRRIARFVGSEFIEDMASFLVEFDELLGGFRERANQVFGLLRQQGVTFVLVAAPEPLAIEEAIYFHQRLVEQEMPFGAFVVNRVQVSMGPSPPPDEVIIRLSLRPELRGFSADDMAGASQTLRRTYQDFEALAVGHQAQIARLRETCGGDPCLVQVPFSERDVYDVEGLTWLGHHLFGEPPPAAPEPQPPV